MHAGDVSIRSKSKRGRSTRGDKGSRPLPRGVICGLPSPSFFFYLSPLLEWYLSECLSGSEAWRPNESVFPVEFELSTLDNGSGHSCLWRRIADLESSKTY